MPSKKILCRVWYIKKIFLRVDEADPLANTIDKACHVMSFLNAILNFQWMRMNKAGLFFFSSISFYGKVDKEDLLQGR